MKSQPFSTTFPNYFALLAGLLLLVGTACETVESGNVDQQRIQTEYTMTYDMHEHKTTAKATFFADNTYLVLTPPAQVFFEETALQKSEIPGFVQYKATLNGMYPTGTFRYTDLDGEHYSNTITLADSLTLPDTLHLSLLGEGSLHWLGNPIGANEKISALIEAEDGTLFLAQNDVENDSTIRFSVAEISQDFLGYHTIWMSRKATQNLQDATDAGGTLFSVFQSNRAVLSITE